MTKDQQQTGNRGQMAQRALAYLHDPTRKGSLTKMNRSAVQTLLGAMQRAASLDEIEIIVRYQQARAKWDSSLVGTFLEDMKKSAQSVTGSGEQSDWDRARIAAEQFSLIARIHRVASEDAGGARNEEG